MKTLTLFHFSNLKARFSKALSFSLLSAALLLTQTIFAQSEISLSSSFDKPLGELNWVYKPAFGYMASYTASDDDQSKMIGGNIGWVQFQPKSDTFYYLLSPTTFGTISYSKYSIFQLSLNSQFNFNTKGKLNWFAGFDLGYYYIYYTYELHEPGSDVEGSLIEGKGAICPKIGLRYHFSDALGVFIQTRYNFYISIGSSDARDRSNYNPNVGKSNHYLSNGIGLFYTLGRKKE